MLTDRQKKIVRMAVAYMGVRLDDVNKLFMDDDGNVLFDRVPIDAPTRGELAEIRRLMVT